MKIFELKCDICGFKIGELTLPDAFDGEMTNETLGFEKIRCDKHRDD